MYRLHTDVGITRRRRVHYVMDESETVRFTSSLIADALDYLYENGIFEVEVTGEKANYIIRIAESGDPFAAALEPGLDYPG